VLYLWRKIFMSLRTTELFWLCSDLDNLLVQHGHLTFFETFFFILDTCTRIPDPVFSTGSLEIRTGADLKVGWVSNDSACWKRKFEDLPPFAPQQPGEERWLGKVQSSLKVHTTLNTSSQKGEEEKGLMLYVIQLQPNKWDTTTSAIGNSSAKKNKTSIHV